MSKHGPTTVTEAARSLGQPAAFVRGVAVGMGLDLDRVGRARVLTPRQFKKLQAKVREYHRLSAAS